MSDSELPKKPKPTTFANYDEAQQSYRDFDFNPADLKEKYIAFVELFRAARTDSFGRTGHTEVSIDKMLEIVPEPQANVFIDTLAHDGVIQREPRYIDFREIYVHFAGVPGPLTLEFNCSMTAEEILDYRHKLQGKKTDSVTFPVSSWAVLEIKFLTDQRVLLTAHEAAGTIQNDYAYDELGFANMKDGRPNMEWAFLYLLAKNEGTVSPTNPDVKDRANMKKRKQLLKDHLQRIFCLNTDPFFDYREHQQYELQCQISVSRNYDT